MQIKADSTSVTAGRFAAYTVATQVAVTITSATAGLSLWYKRAGGTKVVLASVNDLATEDADYNAQGIKVIGGPIHRIDLPNAAYAAGATQVEIGGEATGIEIVGQTVDLIGQATTGAVSADGTEILTRLPDATAGQAGGLLIAGSNAATTFATLTVSGLTTLTGAVALTDITTAGSLGKYIADILGYTDCLPAAWVVPLDATATQAAATAAITAAAIPAGVVTALGNGSTLTEAGGTGDQLTALASAANLATVAGYLDTEITSILGYVDCLPATWVTVPTADAIGTDAASKILSTPANKLATDASGAVTPTAASKTGYSLAATGLDLITATEPSGKPTTFPGWIMWLVQRFRRADKTATALTVKTEAGATVTTQAITSSGDDQTLGPPT